MAKGREAIFLHTSDRACGVPLWGMCITEQNIRPSFVRASAPFIRLFVWHRTCTYDRHDTFHRVSFLAPYVDAPSLTSDIGRLFGAYLRVSGEGLMSITAYVAILDVMIWSFILLRIR